MNQEQYAQWKDFALRMARTCFKHRRYPTWQEIEANVQFFFQEREYNDLEELASFVNWDHSEPYPEGHPRYERKYRCSCWHCHGTKKPDCPYHCEEGEIYDYAHAEYVCDICTEMAEAWNPHYWSTSDADYEKRDEQYCGPVRCCIRAGMDMAAAPSAGVIGFTKKDLQRMYPEGVPDWITGGENHRWSYWLKDELNGTFAEMPDDAQLVL